MPLGAPDCLSRFLGLIATLIPQSTELAHYALAEDGDLFL